MYRQVIVRLIRGLQHFLCDPRVDGDVVLLKGHRKPYIGDLEQLLQVKRPVEDVVAIQHHKVGARDLDAAMLKYKLLVGDIRDIDCLVIRCGAFDFVDCPPVTFAPQNIHGAV